MKDGKVYPIVLHIIFILMTLIFLVPVLMILIISFTGEAEFSTYGFSFFPKVWSAAAYKMLFENIGVMGRAVIFTIVTAVLGTVINIVVNCAFAYPLTRDDFMLKKPVNVILLGTMFVSGGLMPTYMVYTQMYGLKDNPLIYLLPQVGAWGVIVYKTFFKGVPKSLIEAAEIDGANQFKTLWSIVLPMSKPIIGMNFFTGVVGGWNNWQTSLIYITKKEYWTVQYLMQKILNNADVLVKALKESGVRDTSSIPLETMKYAMCIIATVPILLLFPYMQKYFAKGIAVGSVKE